MLLLYSFVLRTPPKFHFLKRFGSKPVVLLGNGGTVRSLDVMGGSLVFTLKGLLGPHSFLRSHKAKMSPVLPPQYTVSIVPKPHGQVTRD